MIFRIVADHLASITDCQWLLANRQLAIAHGTQKHKKSWPVFFCGINFLSYIQSKINKEMWQMTKNMCGGQKTADLWHVVHDAWLLMRDTWHGTQDTGFFIFMKSNFAERVKYNQEDNGMAMII